MTDILEWVFNVLLNSGDCFIRTHFHIYCPGCGGSRAVVALLKGQLIESIKYNPIVFLLLGDIVMIQILGIIERRNGKKYYTIEIVCNIIMLIIWLIHFLVRNYYLTVKGIDLLGDFM